MGAKIKLMPHLKPVHSFEFIVHSLKTTNYKLPTKNWRRRHRGFTLIELLIVISIISILVASATVSWTAAQQRGRDGRRQSDAKAIQQAVELYYQTNGKYPSSSSGQIQCNITGDSQVLAFGSAFVCGSTTYIQQLPKDPTVQDAASGYYYNNTGINTYVLSVKLENTKNPDLTGLLCTPQTGHNYCVTNP